MYEIFAQSTKSGSGVTKQHCNNVASDDSDEATDHPELIEWPEDSIYDCDDSSQANDLERWHDQPEQVQEQERVSICNNEEFEEESDTDISISETNTTSSTSSSQATQSTASSEASGSGCSNVAIEDIAISPTVSPV